jgi:hypothetical protein
MPPAAHRIIHRPDPLPRQLIERFSPWRDLWIRAGWRVQLHSRTGAARLRDPAGHSALYPDFAACRAAAERLAPRVSAKRGVVLLHGLMNYPAIMRPLETVLAGQGWATANLFYPTRELSLAAHAQAASAAARGLADEGAAEIAVIGFSLGGLVARAALARAAADGWPPGRLILIGSPARGAAIADALQRSSLYRPLIGGCADVVTKAGATAVPVPDAPLLIIAGGTGARGYNPLLKGDNDGLIAVAETRLPGAETDFLRVRSRHHALSIHPASVEACAAFLGDA